MDRTLILTVRRPLFNPHPLLPRFLGGIASSAQAFRTRYALSSIRSSQRYPDRVPSLQIRFPCSSLPLTALDPIPACLVAAGARGITGVATANGAAAGMRVASRYAMLRMVWSVS